MSERSPRLANAEEAGELSRLAIASKAHWGYDEAFMAACEPELVKDPADCDAGEIWVIDVNGRIGGMVQLKPTLPVGEITDLWVDPSAMGRGIGRALMSQALDVARSMNMEAVRLDADPNAESFYLHVGFKTIGQVASKTWPDRLLPLMEYRFD